MADEKMSSLTGFDLGISVDEVLEMAKGYAFFLSPINTMLQVMGKGLDANLQAHLMWCYWSGGWSIHQYIKAVGLMLDRPDLYWPEDMMLSALAFIDWSETIQDLFDEKV